MKPISQHTDQELLALTNEELNDGICIEAISRGVKPPVTLSEALTKSEWRGYKMPALAIEVFEFKAGYSSSGFGYLDKAAAIRALDGMVVVETNSYGDRKTSIKNEDITLLSRFVGVRNDLNKAAKFEEYTQNDTEFDKIRDECLERYSNVRQGAYNAKVLVERMAEYLRLARGDEDIARGFWARSEGTEWPATSNTCPNALRARGCTVPDGCV